MSAVNYLLSGFGGQGILFAGKFLTYKGLIENKQVSWLPSYGPEMRGGTASCSVIVSDEPVGSPIVTYPDVLVAMNLPALDKFEKDVVPGGSIYINSTLVERKAKRDDVDIYYIPATALADENGLGGLANMIMTGYIMKTLGIENEESIKESLNKCVKAGRQDLWDLNYKAIKTGIDYKE